jgi:hypothetical protein
LFLYWGNAIEVLHRGARGDALKATRAQAAKPYLQGLKETLQYTEQVRKTPLPATHPGISGKLRPDKQELTAPAYAAWKREELLERLAVSEGHFHDQLAFLYSRRPFATDELANLTRDVLQDTAAVDRLMARVNARIRKRGE